jgi:hypothetical protein
MELLSLKMTLYVEMALGIFFLTQLLKWKFKTDGRILTTISAVVFTILEYLLRKDFSILSAGISIVVATGGYSYIFTTLRDTWNKIKTLWSKYVNP